jgi:hypothetical protein
MFNTRQLETLFSFGLAYLKNPRVSVRELHKKYSHYKNRDATRRLLYRARKKEALIGPTMWCNIGIDVQLKYEIDDPLLLFEHECKDPSVTYMMALIGKPSIICFRSGASILKYGEAIMPSFPLKGTIEGIRLEKKGKLPDDRYPHGWDDLDWDVYKMMRDPTGSFVKIGRELGVSWHTVKNRFEKIMKDCKTWVTFLPKGYDNYQQSVLLFKTEYEVGLRDELQKLDRTSVLYKFGDTIMLQLFLDYTLQNLVFYKLKREGLIHDLQVSIPIGWYSSP